MTRKKHILQRLQKCIKHDFGFYNPKWKWSSLPDDIQENYELIEDVLLDWKDKKYIDLYEKDGDRYIEIFKVPKF